MFTYFPSMDGLCRRTVVAACCLTYCAVFLLSCLIVLSFLSHCLWCRAVYATCCAIFGIVLCGQSIALSCHRIALDDIFLLLVDAVFAFSLFLCYRAVLVTVLSSASPCLLVSCCAGVKDRNLPMWRKSHQDNNYFRVSNVFLSQ